MIKQLSSCLQIQRISAEELQNGGQSLKINYSYSTTDFGRIFTASTECGVCFMGFSDVGKPSFDRVQKDFPKARYFKKKDDFQKQALLTFQDYKSTPHQINLHLKGTDFQIKVWKRLVKIIKGNLSTYSEIAKGIGNPKAVRAVGTAIGRNPISIIIPCHRVIQSSGKLGGYMWGVDKKSAIIDWETKNARSFYDVNNM